MRALPEKFQQWFASKGWQIHPHQQALLDQADSPATLLIAPTGGGKTLAGFLPSLTELSDHAPDGLHTLYVSPLKALAADIRRNLQTPVDEIGLPIRIEDRTGDTGTAQRKRQRVDPPHILLTTPESLALLLSYEDAPRMFAGLRRVVIDEIHALADSKRGDQLFLCLARLEKLAPDFKRIGLSATVEDPPALAQLMARNPTPCALIEADPGPPADIRVLHTDDPPPWAGMTATYAVPKILEAVRDARTTLIFINTRAQAEVIFHEIWKHNLEDLPIGLHHGSLSREARDRVEGAMVAGQLRAVVCTATLDLGIDWGAVDLVIQVGSPKNVKKLVQRIGRANHQYNAPSRALVVPSNRFEVLEAQAALDAVAEHDLDGEPRDPGPRDVLCQHILLLACGGPIDANELFAEVVTAGPYADLTRADFDACLEFCATGGYSLRAYDRWQRLMKRDGLWVLRDPRMAQRLRMNVGTIVDTETLKVRFRGRGGKPLGEVEEAFAATLTPGDTFQIGGQTVRYEGLREMTVQVTKAQAKKPKFAVFSGTKFAASTVLTNRVIEMMDSRDWAALPAHTQDWLALQEHISQLPRPGRMLVESFRRGDREFTTFFGFAGRNALQTLGLLVTKRMEQQGLQPLGFVTTDYALSVRGLQPVENPAALLTADGLREGLETWLQGNAVMKKTFRTVASIAGLIEKNTPGKRKTGKQATFSSDILYDTLAKYDPDHLLMQITREEANRGLVDFGRIEEMLRQYEDRIDHVQAPHVTPFSAPLLLEMGKVPIMGSGREKLAEDETAELMREAGLML
ncbi:MAG: ligase-associated DNA damage response DEXH box helicase [Pseudomonadota bacterium]